MCARRLLFAAAFLACALAYEDAQQGDDKEAKLDQAVEKLREAIAAKTVPELRTFLRPLMGKQVQNFATGEAEELTPETDEVTMRAIVFEKSQRELLKIDPEKTKGWSTPSAGPAPPANSTEAAAKFMVEMAEHMKSLDTDGDGVLTREELAADIEGAEQALDEAGQEPTDLFEEMDTNKDGLIDKEEVKAAITKMNMVRTSQMEQKAPEKIIFQSIDKNGDGDLSPEEMEGTLKTAKEKFEEMGKDFEVTFDCLDTDEDGLLDPEEHAVLLSLGNKCPEPKAKAKAKAKPAKPKAEGNAEAAEHDEL